MYAEPTNVQRRMVLLIEDDPAQCALYDRMLRRWGYDTITLLTSRLACRALNVARCSVVVSDVMLGNESGFALAQSFRRSHPDVPVVLMSAAATPETQEEALRVGAVAFVSKSDADPMLRRALFSAVTRTVASRARTSEVDALEGWHASISDDFSDALRRLHALWAPVVNAAAPDRNAHSVVAASSWPELAAPSRLARAAAERGVRHELGRALRATVATALALRDDLDPVFMKVTYEELMDESLGGPLEPLSAFARRVVLGIDDVAVGTGNAAAVARIKSLRVRGFRICVHDTSPMVPAWASSKPVPYDMVAVDYESVRISRGPRSPSHRLGALIAPHVGRRVPVLVDGVMTQEECLVALHAGADYVKGTAIGPVRSLPPPRPFR